jgi:hypothetical protein
VAAQHRELLRDHARHRQSRRRRVRLFAKSETCKCIANFRLIFLKCNRLKQLMIQSVD